MLSTYLIELEMKWFALNLLAAELNNCWSILLWNTYFSQRVTYLCSRVQSYGKLLQMMSIILGNMPMDWAWLTLIKSVMYMEIRLKDEKFKIYFLVKTFTSYMNFPTWSCLTMGYFNKNPVQEPGHVIIVVNRTICYIIVQQGKLTLIDR